jgi:hypothetical protein
LALRRRLAFISMPNRFSKGPMSRRRSLAQII